MTQSTRQNLLESVPTSDVKVNHFWTLTSFKILKKKKLSVNGLKKVAFIFKLGTFNPLTPNLLGHHICKVSAVYSRAIMISPVIHQVSQQKINKQLFYLLINHLRQFSNKNAKHLHSQSP